MNRFLRRINSVVESIPFESLPRKIVAYLNFLNYYLRVGNTYCTVLL
jgi:hypothetical protein